ncbi:glycosyltransferase family 4 protein [Gramella sp. GC03-9]|uniref:Glycosyltransferase family 4 protein n=1 Tax=Christiangramia oceanisediminis TaxID=2920386 RepID=A0A9X2HZT1_9FLAO|nr:glycosyltransferase family 4 protein [Gramella oceanisediminis]MCP9198296.1 glycosyltransferase family 4 protein [Gramella oceanisediminis]
MRFTIFSHAPHKEFEDKIYSYGPYVREINLWTSSFDEIRIVAPRLKGGVAPNEYAYDHQHAKLIAIPQLYFKNIPESIKSIFRVIFIIPMIFIEMIGTQHIHIRCPGNIGLLACIIQIFFPGKKKTVKYAGNWDPRSEQPMSYRFQKWILRNRFLTKNAKVLIYGEWEDMKDRKNLIPFYTASFSESDKIEFSKSFQGDFRFSFLGSLVNGKRPNLAIKIIEQMRSRGHQVSLDIFGNGPLESALEEYIRSKALQDVVHLRGVKDVETIKKELQDSHFVILPSKSEGWPKALAEGMFFGCIPIATPVSCVPWMLGYGKRGILIDPEVNDATSKIEVFLSDPEKLKKMSEKSTEWARNYTLEKFHESIRKFL